MSAPSPKTRRGRGARGLEPLGLDAAELIVGERDDALWWVADLAAEGGPDRGEVLSRGRDEAEAIEAGGEGADSVGGHPPGGRAEAYDAARGGRNARAARRVGGEREQRRAGGDRDRRAAAGAAGAAVWVAGV